MPKVATPIARAAPAIIVIGDRLREEANRKLSSRLAVERFRIARLHGQQAPHRSSAAIRVTARISTVTMMGSVANADRAFVLCAVADRKTISAANSVKPVGQTPS